jgi:hypothetical protein
MGSCDAVRHDMATLAPRRPEGRPAWLRAHAAEGHFCARAVWARQAMQATLEAPLLHRGTAARGTSDDSL